MNRWILLAMIPALHWLRRKMISGRYHFRTRQRHILLLQNIMAIKTMQGSEAACQVIVKEKKTQTGSGALEAPEGPENRHHKTDTTKTDTTKPAPEEPATENQHRRKSRIKR